MDDWVPELGALLPLLWREGFPFSNRLQKKNTVGTLILTCLLEDLDSTAGMLGLVGVSHPRTGKRRLLRGFALAWVGAPGREGRLHLRRGGPQFRYGHGA